MLQIYFAVSFCRWKKEKVMQLVQQTISKLKGFKECSILLVFMRVNSC